MEVGQGPNWGCSTKGKKKIRNKIMHFAVIVSCQQIAHSYIRRGSVKREWSYRIHYCTRSFVEVHGNSLYQGSHVQLYRS
jgi:hypothetical protein